MASDRPTAPIPPQPVRRKSSPALAGLVLLTVVLGLFLVAGSFLLLTQKVITLEIDGQVSTVYTRQQTVGDVLEELGAPLQSADNVVPTANTPIEDGLIIQVQRAQPVMLIVDGLVSERLSYQHAAADILAEANITLARYDQVWVNGEPVADPSRPSAYGVPAVLEIKRAVQMTVDVDGQPYTLHTTEATIGEALHTIGLPLYVADSVEPEPDTPPSEGLHVIVERAAPVTIIIDDTEVASRSNADTIGGALAEAGMVLLGDDYSIPGLETPIPPDGRIRVVRVTEDILINQREIPYGTIYQADPDIPLDEQYIVRSGEVGTAAQYTRIRYENGEEISRIEEPEIIQQAPVDEVIAYGTDIVIHTLETDDGPREYWRVIPMLATSYSPSEAGFPEGEGSGVAGTGLDVVQGIVAVDPEVIPYFTQVYVPGYGDGLAADTGGAVNGRRIDLGYSDDELVLWYSWVDVYLLTPAPDVDDILYILP